MQKREQKVQIFRNVRQETWKNNCGNSGKHAAGPDERADVITFYGQEFSELKTPYNYSSGRRCTGIRTGIDRMDFLYYDAEIWWDKYWK